MRTQRIAGTSLEVSRIGYGCMGLGGSWDSSPVNESTQKDAMAAIRTALDQGINFFDHADIYAQGKSEAVFSEVWREAPGLRDQIVLQSKCGIRFAGDPDADSPGRYDFSHDHIVRSVDGSLRRLKTDFLDILLLHRPDPLVEPEEVARAFDLLHKNGKVRHFGVSNHSPAQMELLRRWIDQPLVVNQLEISAVHNHLLNAGVVFNQDNPPRPLRGEGTIEYCRLHDITIQAWSPVAKGAVSGNPIDSDNSRLQKVADLIGQMAKDRDVSPDAILVAWLLRHPAQIQPIIGTRRPERIQETCQGDTVVLSREEWYQIFIAGRGAPMP